MTTALTATSPPPPIARLALPPIRSCSPAIHQRTT
jgi:hypothetical protein